jgi:poly(A) polymerase
VSERGDPLSVLADLQTGGWLVGGAVRDRALGRTVTDFDVVVPDDAESVARRLGPAAGGFVFRLSEAFGAWRVIAHDHSWQIDLLAIGDSSIEEDLARRDLTANAIAHPLDGGAPIDPFGGWGDIERRRLRAVSDRSFRDDPLRTMRLARLACELDFVVEEATLELAAASASGLSAVAPERIFEELKRIICCDSAPEGLAVMDRVGATRIVLPELSALDGVQQSRFHHLDVAGHTRAALTETLELERDPERLAGSQARALAAYLAAPLANGLTRGQALRFGVLLHDIAKPGTRGVTAEGRVTFMGHDEVGAGLASEILGRLRASERLREHVAALTRHHLRLGFLVHDMPLDRRAVYDYLRVTSPVAIDVTILGVADRLATRGDNAEVAISRHLELARQMVCEGLQWAQHPPRPPVRGDDLARALGIAPGPAIGDLLAELEAESFTGALTSREQAIERARQLIEFDR